MHKFVLTISVEDSVRNTEHTLRNSKILYSCSY